MEETIFPKGIEIVTSAVLQKDGKIFLAKSPKWSNKWTLPGGHIEVGETIIDSCLREVVEETGIKAKPLAIINTGELIGSKDFHRPAHFIYFDVLFSVLDDDVNLDGQELTEYGWFTPEEALKLDLGEDYDITIIKYRDYVKSRI